MDHLSRMKWIAAVAAITLSGGCFVNPQYDGESVRCAADGDCAHLQGTFECHVDAGLCVRVDGQGACDPACEAGEVCQDGVCVEEVIPPCGGECPQGYVCDEDLDECVGDPENCDPACHALDLCLEDDGAWTCGTGPLRLAVSAPEPYAFVQDAVVLEGTVRYGTDDGDPSVLCELDGAEAPVTVEGGEPVPGSAGVLIAPWSCAVDLSESTEGALEIQITAEGTLRSGALNHVVRRDVTEPVITLLTVAGELDTDTIYVPQQITVEAAASDRMGTEDGKLTRLLIEVFAPSGHVVYTKDCTGGTETSLACSGSFPLLPDAGLEADAWHTEAGTYTVRASAWDAAGNPPTDDDATTSLVEKLFDVVRSPDIGVYVAKTNEHPGDSIAVRVRRHEGALIEVRSDRPEQIVGDPLLEIRQARIREEDGACVESIALGDRLEHDGSERGYWSMHLPAQEPCLPSAEKTYMVAAVVEDVWTHDPDAPRSLDGVECDGPNEACATLQITRQLWEPADVCGERDACSVLTPAVASAGTVFAATNFQSGGQPGHALHRIPMASGTPGEWWASSTWTRFHLVDGPVVHESGLDRRVLVNGGGILLALQDGQIGERLAWEYPPFGNTTVTVLGSPAVGRALYVPIRFQVVPGEGEELLPPEGGLAVLAATDGSEFGSSYLGDPMDGLTQLVVRPGDTSEWVALFDPDAQGGRFQCDWPGGTCLGRGLPSPGSRRGNLAAHGSGYFLGYGEDEGDELSRFDWARNSSSDQPSWTLPGTSILAGPVFDSVWMVYAGEELLTIISIPGGGDDVEVATALPDDQAPVGLSLGQGGPYVLYESGLLEARDMEGALLWNERLSAPAPGARPTLTSVSNGTNSVGVLLVPSGAKLHALITDDAGPVRGWANDRGDPSRRGAAPSQTAEQ